MLSPSARVFWACVAMLLAACLLVAVLGCQLHVHMFEQPPRSADAPPSVLDATDAMMEALSDERTTTAATNE